MITSLLASATATDDQLAIQLLVELLLLTLPSRDGLRLGNVGPVRLPMADRSKPGEARGQHYRPAPRNGRVRSLAVGMIGSCADRQIGKDGDSVVPVGRICRRQQADKDEACGRSAD